jgi:hypothetical protein
MLLAFEKAPKTQVETQYKEDTERLKALGARGLKLRLSNELGAEIPYARDLAAKRTLPIEYAQVRPQSSSIHN